MKTCPRCNLEKSRDLFHNAKTKDGKQGHCKECKKELGPIYEKTRSKEKKRQYGKAEWQAKKNSERYITYRKKWLLENKESVAIKAKKYREENKILLLTARSNQRAKKKGIDGKISRSEWLAALEITHYKCISCEEELANTIDHVISFKNGGTNTYDNIQPMCLRCNLKKGTREVDFRPRGFVESIRENSKKL
jgi:5-methylcytosine-specific restriction endonuclease McrA